MGDRCLMHDEPHPDCAACHRTRIAALEADLAQARREAERLREVNDALRKGQPIGPIIGAQALMDCDAALREARAQVEALTKALRRFVDGGPVQRIGDVIAAEEVLAALKPSAAKPEPDFAPCRCASCVPSAAKETT